MRTEMVRPTELAAELGIPVKTLAEWRSRGLGPAYVKVGRHVRYRREAIDDWEARQTRQPAGEATAPTPNEVVAYSAGPTLTPEPTRRRDGGTYTR
jgi:predicted DNA-binding transcriptional regulator AlpA